MILFLKRVRWRCQALLAAYTYGFRAARNFYVGAVGKVNFE